VSAQVGLGELGLLHNALLHACFEGLIAADWHADAPVLFAVFVVAAFDMDQFPAVPFEDAAR
jgi:hypothetical protein